MSTFREIVAEVTGIVPGYSAFLAKRDLEKAWRDILDRRTWSFLVTEGGFNAPPQIQTGTVSVVQNSPFITASTLAAAAFDVATTQTPNLLARQFRISSAGAIYDIIAWDTVTNTLTVSRPILEPTATTASYFVYQCYFPPPPESLQSDGTYDFNRFISIIDPVNGYVIKDGGQKQWLDYRDPQRSTVNLAYRYFNYKNVGNTPFYELWPHPTSGQEFVVLYKSRGLGFVLGNEEIPQMIPASLLLDRCLFKYTYRWAWMNAGRDPKLAHTNYGFMISEGAKQWERDLQAVKLEDENVNLQALLGPRWRLWGPPVDANFLQSHSSGLEPWV